MEKSRLLRLLRTFSPTELRDLEKFAQAGLTKQRPEVAALLAVLSKSLRHGRPVPDKETAFRQIFHREGYDDHRVRLAMSGLYRLAGQFLAVQDFLADAPAAPLRLAQVLRHRRWREVAPRGPEAAPRAAFAEAAAAQARQPWRNADFYEAHYHLSLECHRFELDVPASEQLDLQGLSRDLDQAFLARKLWQSCFMLAHQPLLIPRTISACSTRPWPMPRLPGPWSSPR